MAYKIPKRITGLAKTAIDPFGLGVGDAVFGKNAGPDYSAQEAEKAKALADNKAATDAFVAGGPAKYSAGKNLDFSSLGPAERQSDSEMGNITTDPRYKDQQLRSLADLQDQSQNGFNASDRADMARSRAAVDAANRGRIGAIQQRYNAQGQGGSGLGMLAEMQSGQDAAQIEALRGLETEANAEQRKTAASAAAGGLATNLQGTEFNQAAAKAAAQDRINQFNTQNSNQNAMYNNQGVNNVNAQNWGRTNQTSDRNATAQYDFGKDVLGAKQGQGQQDYNAATDTLNNRKLDNAAAEQKAAGVMGAVGGIGGAVVGGVYGGPQGAQIGSQVGSGAGQVAGRNNYGNTHYWKGGKVPGQAPHPGDDPRNDVVGALVAPGETILPRSVAGDPVKSAKFVAKLNQKQAPAAPAAPVSEDDDVIAHMLKAMNAMHRKGSK